MLGFLLVVGVSLVGAVLIAKWTVKIGELLLRLGLHKRGLTNLEKFVVVIASHMLWVVVFSLSNLPRLGGRGMFVGALFIFVDMGLVMVAISLPTREETS